MSTIPSPEPGSYIEAVTAEDDRLKAVLAGISADEEAGNLTTREAADNRIAALERHIAKCQALRIRFFGNGE